MKLSLNFITLALALVSLLASVLGSPVPIANFGNVFRWVSGNVCTASRGRSLSFSRHCRSSFRRLPHRDTTNNIPRESSFIRSHSDILRPTSPQPSVSTLAKRLKYSAPRLLFPSHETMIHYKFTDVDLIFEMQPPARDAAAVAQAEYHHFVSGSEFRKSSFSPEYQDWLRGCADLKILEQNAGRRHLNSIIESQRVFVDQLKLRMLQYRIMNDWVRERKVRDPDTTDDFLLTEFLSDEFLDSSTVEVEFQHSLYQETLQQYDIIYQKVKMSNTRRRSFRGCMPPDPDSDDEDRKLVAFSQTSETSPTRDIERQLSEKRVQLRNLKTDLLMAAAFAAYRLSYFEAKITDFNSKLVRTSRVVITNSNILDWMSTHEARIVSALLTRGLTRLDEDTVKERMETVKTYIEQYCWL